MYENLITLIEIFPKKVQDIKSPFTHNYNLNHEIKTMKKITKSQRK